MLSTKAIRIEAVKNKVMWCSALIWSGPTWRPGLVALVTALALAGFTGGCARLERVPQTAASVACDRAETVFADLQALPLSTSEALQGISIPDGRGTFSPTISHRVDGPCAERIARFVMELVYVQPSTVGKITAEGRIVPVDLPFRMHTLESTDPHPELAGGRFLMAERIDGRRIEGQVTETLIGLWSTSEGAILGSFSRLPDGTFSPVVEEMRTDFAVQGISYFGWLHGGVGRLGLVSQAGGGVRLVAFEWAHPGL